MDKQVDFLREENKLNEILDILNNEILNYVEKRKGVTKYILDSRKKFIEEYKDGYFHGFTSNYIPVKLKGNYEINSLINIKLTKENINFDLNQ